MFCRLKVKQNNNLNKIKMKDLKDLIGQKVIVDSDYEDKDGNAIFFKAEIIDVVINDYYFHEKNESIYITVNVSPIGDLPEGIDFESDEEVFCGISLDKIKKI
jgi:hypothetical protein